MRSESFNFGRAVKCFSLILLVLMCSVHAILFLSTRLASDSPEMRTETTPEDAVSMKPRDTDALYKKFQEELDLILQDEKADFAVYWFCPDVDDKPFCWQARPMHPASMIKLFIMAKAMEDIGAWKISLNDKLTFTDKNAVGGAGVLIERESGSSVTVGELIELMIAESDNTATNMLIDYLGMEAINGYISENRYTDTIVQNKMMITNSGQQNFSSVRDIGDLLTAIYRHDCVDEYHDNLMITYLLRQKDRECFPTALPNWQIAHKTGEITDVYNDGGIFFGANGNFVLVVMSESKAGRTLVIDKMQKIARTAASLSFITN